MDTINSCWSRRGDGFMILPEVNAIHYQNGFMVHNSGGRKCIGLFPKRPLPGILHKTVRCNLKAPSSGNYAKKVQKDGTTPGSRKFLTNKQSSNEHDPSANASSDGEFVSGNSSEISIPNMAAGSSTSMPRGVVIQACAITSGLILALGVLIRQVSHIASLEGWPVRDSCTEVSFDFEMWHLELIIGLVMLISSCRYLLLKIWPDFAESSEAGNEQVLSSLQPLDYLVVAFLPGISEELLFRGALLPLFGLNWTSALAVGAIFGVLHLGSGRRYSFTAWATFVGFAYGFATIISSSVIVPIASHSLNNLIGGILWRHSSNLTKKN